MSSARDNIVPRSPRLCLIDDEPAALRAMEFVLRTNGFTWLYAAQSWSEASNILHHTPCEVVLMDINMPGINGIDALLELREHWPDSLTIMMTGVSELKTAVLAMKRGAADYLTKPLNRDELIHTINSVLIDKVMSDELGMSTAPPAPAKTYANYNKDFRPFCLMDFQKPSNRARIPTLHRPNSVSN